MTADLIGVRLNIPNGRDKMKQNEVMNFLEALDFNPRMEKGRIKGGVTFIMCNNDAEEALKYINEKDRDEVIDRYNQVMDEFFEEKMDPILTNYYGKPIETKELMEINHKIRKMIKNLYPISKNQLIYYLCNKIMGYGDFGSEKHSISYEDLINELTEQYNKKFKKYPCCGGTGGEYRTVFGPQGTIFEECYCCDGSGMVSKDFNLEEKAKRSPPFSKRL
jgi:hypothetical protein